MNVFDQFAKRTLRCRHYGRYVDDVYIVHNNPTHLKSLLPAITRFLNNQLGLQLNPAKTHITDATRGIEFLGAYIKPFRTYISNNTLKRIKQKLYTLPEHTAKTTQSRTNSLLGVLSHYNTYRLRRLLFGNFSPLNACGRFNPKWLKFTPYGLKH